MFVLRRIHILVATLLSMQSWTNNNSNDDDQFITLNRVVFIDIADIHTYTNQSVKIYNNNNNEVFLVLQVYWCNWLWLNMYPGFVSVFLWSFLIAASQNLHPRADIKWHILAMWTHYWSVLARFISLEVNVEGLPLSWGLSSLKLEFSIASSLSCCLLYRSCDSSCTSNGGE